MYEEQVEWLDDVGFDRGDECDEAIETQCSCDGDEDAAYEHHELADSCNDQIADSVVQDNLESVFGSHTKVLSSQGYLDIRCFINELNYSFDASEATPQTIDSVFEAFRLIGSSVFSLFLGEFNNHLQELNNG